MTESHGIQFRIILRIARDLASLISSALRSRAQLAAENLFLKKQLALYPERQVKPAAPTMPRAWRWSRYRASSTGVVC